MLNRTDSARPGSHVIDSGILSYATLWTMSVNDWYWTSGNVSGRRAMPTSVPAQAPPTNVRAGLHVQHVLSAPLFPSA